MGNTMACEAVRTVRRSDAAAEAAVRCRRITKEFRSGETRVTALRGVDLDIPYGELTLLVGPSGCGKTTLISVIAALLEPTQGDLEVLGRRMAGLSGTQKVRFRGQSIGFVFQQYNLLPSLTARENAAIPLLTLGWPRRRALHRADELLDAVGLADRRHALPAQLSGGQQQRVAIARSLVHQPRLLVCDEPTAALDAHSGQTVMQLIRDVALHADRAVIVVTHDNRVHHYGDRVVEMSDGQVTRIAATSRGAGPGDPVAERGGNVRPDFLSQENRT